LILINSILIGVISIYSVICSNSGIDAREGSSKNPQTTTSAASESPLSVPFKSFAKYREEKGKQWKSRVSKSSDSKNKKKDEDVVINISLMEWSVKDQELKSKRGKKLPLKISPTSNYTTLSKKAEEKWKNFHSNLYDEHESYKLLYEDGSKALFLPGSKKESFSLRRYQEEIGKDFKRITMYLCTNQDFKISEGDFDDEEVDESQSQDDDGKHDDNLEKPLKRPKYSSDDDDMLVNDDPLGKLDKPLKHLIGNSSTPVNIDLTVPHTTRQTELDAHLATQLQKMYDETESAESESITNGVDNDGACAEVIKLSNPCSVVQALTKNVDKSGQLFIVVRRGSPLFRVLAIWRRQVKNNPLSANQVLRVHFNGEQGIDSGAMALEFLTQTLPNIGSVMFPNGTPVDSTFHVQNENFLTCGQIVASSLSQGGPPPCFLDESVFNLMVELNLRPNEIDELKHLTESDRVFLKSVQDDLTSHTDTIIDNGYTGVIDEMHSDQIIKSMIINIISKRLLYVREFMDGLKSFGLADIIQNHPESCRTLFVKCSQPSKVDANFLFSILDPIYTLAGSSRRKVEESIMDFFQDFLFKLEDEKNILGYTEAVAWNESRESAAEVSNADQPTEQFQSQDLTPAGILGWLTGQKHIPLGEKPLKVSVNFNHDCRVNNPNHRICFPVVGACAREITLPVTHMKTTEDFNEVFLLAFCKGQSFGKT
jgi:hypothetical protein